MRLTDAKHGSGAEIATVRRIRDAGRHIHPGATTWLLLGPCLVYLAAFAIYPLIYSLRLSFTDLTAADGTGRWIGFKNYGDLLSDPQFWNAAKNSVIIVVATVALQVVLGTALALFFNLRLRGSSIVRGILVLPMLITPIIVGVMWRALLNPDWGLVNWAVTKLGIEPPNWLGSIEMAMKTLIIVDVWQWTPFVFIIVFARLQALPQDVYEASAIDGAGPITTFRHITLPLLAPAIALPRFPRRRCIPLVRSDLRAQLRRAGAQHDDPQLFLVPKRLSIPELRLRRRGRLHDAVDPYGRNDRVAALRSA